jgi:hypothetical protein
MIITVFSERSPPKIFCVSSTVTLPTDTAPRPIWVVVRISFAGLQRGLKCAVQHAARELRLVRRLVRVLQLSL